VSNFAELITFVCAKFEAPEKVKQYALQHSKTDITKELSPKEESESLLALARLIPCLAIPPDGETVLYDEPPPAASQGITREYVARLGQYWWPITFGSGHKMDTLEETLKMGKAMLNVLSSLGLTWLYEALQRDSSTQELMMGAAQWANNAFPVIQLGGHRYAAALMATQVPQDLDIRPPWPSFVIDLPTNLLWTVNTETGLDEPIEFILVQTMGARWTILAHTKNVNLHRSKWTVHEMASNQSIDVFPESEELDSRDPKTLLLLTRLALNACLAMSDPSNVKQVGKHGNAKVGGGRAKQESPSFRTFKVGKPIELDVRPALQAYLDGSRKASPTVQFLVRGHWRNQAMGPQHSMHRMTWIAPYWKGPEDAAIHVRPHIMGKE